MSLLSTFPGSGPYVGEGMLVFIGFRAVDGAEARIATPLISFENASYPELRFHFYYLDMSDQDLRFDDHMVVEVSVDGGEFRRSPRRRLLPARCQQRLEQNVCCRCRNMPVAKTSLSDSMDIRQAVSIFFSTIFA